MISKTQADECLDGKVENLKAISDRDVDNIEPLISTLKLC
jgi:hypothetical protein